jgi:enediyne biosynthesis protein E8
MKSNGTSPSLEVLIAKLRIDRREFLRAVATALVWLQAPVLSGAPARAEGGSVDPAVAQTLEAFADTLIPGEKRSAADRAIAGGGVGAGAVQAGALQLLSSPRSGLASLLPALSSQLNADVVAFAAARGIDLDPAVPPLVALDFPMRTAFLVELMAGAGASQAPFLLLALVVFLAYHAAAHLPTVDAVREHHPGLAAIGFPLPQADGLWRFPDFSYRRRLARRHPRTRRGSPV